MCDHCPIKWHTCSITCAIFRFSSLLPEGGINPIPYILEHISMGFIGIILVFVQDQEQL